MMAAGDMMIQVDQESIDALVAVCVRLERLVAQIERVRPFTILGTLTDEQAKSLRQQIDEKGNG